MKGYTRRRTLALVLGLLGLPLLVSRRAYSSSADLQPEKAVGLDLVVVGGWIVDRRDLPPGSPESRSE